MAPIDTMTTQQIRSLESNILTEHFRWSPETFAKQGMDLANLVMYEATKQVEDRLNEIAATKGDTSGFSEDDIQRGIFRLETLLENAIDRHFDLFELYLYRNVFKLQVDLIPHVVLNHQAGLDESLRDADTAALEEYEEEVRLYEEQLQSARDLAIAEEWALTRVERARQRAELVGYLTSSSEPLPKRADSLSKAVQQAIKTVESLIDVPLPSSASESPTRTDKSSTDAPWGSSRSSFLNWATRAKIDALPRSAAGASTGAVKADDAQTKAGEALLKSLRS